MQDMPDEMNDEPIKASKKRKNRQIESSEDDEMADGQNGLDINDNDVKMKECPPAA